MDSVKIPDRFDTRTLLLSILILLAGYFRQKILKTGYKFPRVNGVLASRAQIKLAKSLRIKHINYKVGNRYIDIAIPGRKIAIEYNGVYWHKGNEEQDRKRAQELIDQGWKVLVINSKGKIPSVSFVRQHINKLTNKNPYIEVFI